VVHLAGTLAAKEAVIKALNLGSLASRAASIEILRDEGGAPRVLMHGDPSATGVSITHDGGIAAAVAIVTGRGGVR
jgi:phosphopantetheine--protein transferase-like protein